MLENQFITPEEVASLHLQSLIASRLRFRQPAKHAHKQTLDRVLAQLQEGSSSISKTQKSIEQLLDAPVLTDSQKRLEQAHKKQQQRQLLNQLLFGLNKNKQSSKEGNTSQKLLSANQHSLFINNMRKDNEKRKEIRERRERNRYEKSLAQLELQKKSNEEKRISEIQKKKDSIKQNLRKMRQNHEKLLITEKQSRAFFNKIRKKKRLYQEMKQSQDERSMEEAREAQRRLVEHRQESRFDLGGLNNHEKQYKEWKKQRSLEKSRTKLEQSKQQYKAPPRSKKLNQFLEEEFKIRNKTQENKKVIEEKLRRIGQYSSLIKERFKPQSPKRNKTVVTDRQNTSHQTLRDQIDRLNLGNQYMKQAKLQSKKRSKTEERYFNPQQNTNLHTSSRKQKNRIETLGFIPKEKRSQHIEKKKREEIQNLLKMDKSMSEAEVIQRIKMADERVSIELRRKSEGIKSKYSRQNALSLLLSTIKAKMNLMNAYDSH